MSWLFLHIPHGRVVNVAVDVSWWRVVVNVSVVACIVVDVVEAELTRFGRPLVVSAGHVVVVNLLLLLGNQGGFP